MCGLAGIISKDSLPFDYSSFCVLGIANDSRGGDSCGVFIDGKYEYGVDANKYFQDYFPDSNLLSSIEYSSIALLHCRKASVGNISEQTAQPVIIKNEKGEVEFVTLHNGTIYNYEELADKYIPEIDIKGMTDSQVMAYIFYNCGYNVLSEYNGGAAFVMVDYRGGTPKVLFFKGASKKYKTSKDKEEERPLYYCLDKENEELIFSSIYPYLMALRPRCDTYSFPSNTLLEFAGNTLKVVQKYSRDNMLQTKEVVKSNYYSVYSAYVTVDLLNNTYINNGKKLHGKVLLSKFGIIYEYPIKGVHMNELYFFNGVLLYNAKCFKFLSDLQKKLGLTLEKFCSMFENLIRFLSIDQAYYKNEAWVKAITPLTYIPYNGSIHPITTQYKITINNGRKISSIYSGFGDVDPTLERDINFKSIERLCKSLMK